MNLKIKVRRQKNFQTIEVKNKIINDSDEKNVAITFHIFIYQVINRLQKQMLQMENHFENKIIA